MHHIHHLNIVLEYRNTTKGHFTFQTFINLTGGYISSFTELKDQNNQMDMSYCNFVNTTINALDHQSSIIFVNNCSVCLSNFCFVGIEFENSSVNFSLVFFADDHITNVTLVDSFIDYEIRSKISNINTVSISYYTSAETKITNSFKLLNLGYCQGEQSPPPIPSSVFTQCNWVNI